MTRYLITSALPYINGVKHLGNLVGSMLPADVYARYLRQRGREVLYVCATDEHGTPAELAAQQACQPVEEYCREQHEIQANVCRNFGLSFDIFGRSSSAENHARTKHIARRLAENGFLQERKTQQFYSIVDGRFLPDRYVVGTCPNCEYHNARGDQCENCAKLLDPTELLNPRSAVSGSDKLELRESRHLYLLLSSLQKEVERWLEGHSNWPVLVRSIATKWLKEGLKDRSITRDLDWGIPVDQVGFEGKVFYVWFDAPIEYIAATEELANRKKDEDLWRRWWYEASDVRYVQFMAKDNIPFHTVWFPAMLLGTGEPWKLVNYIKGFNWLNYYGGKFSTSSQRGVFMDVALELLPADYWRYALMSSAPESSDVDFTWESFGTIVNKQLADGFGNYAQRVLTMVHRNANGRIPVSGSWTTLEQNLIEDLTTRIEEYTDALEAIEFRKASHALESIWAIANRYWTNSEPWKTIKHDEPRALTTIAVGLNLLRILAVLSAPWVPATSDQLLRGLDATSLAWIEPTSLERELRSLPPGHQINPVPILFRKITDSELVSWKERFAGSQQLEPISTKK